MSLLDVKDLRVEFTTQDGNVTAVNDLNFSLERGETLGIVGESGSGKSVTALSIMGLIPNPPGFVDNGEILFENQNLLSLNEDQLRKIRGNKISMKSSLGIETKFELTALETQIEGLPETTVETRTDAQSYNDVGVVWLRDPDKKISVENDALKWAHGAIAVSIEA